MYTCKENKNSSLLSKELDIADDSYNRNWKSTVELGEKNFEFECIYKIIERLKKYKWMGYIFKDKQPVLLYKSGKINKDFDRKIVGGWY